MADENKLTIKKSGGFGMLCDTEDLSILHNGKEMLDIRSIKIDMGLEDAMTATVEIVDLDLDLENIPFEIKVDELCARKLLKEILNDEGSSISDDFIDEVVEMTKGMGDTVDVTCRGSKGFRQTLKVKDE